MAAKKQTAKKSAPKKPVKPAKSPAKPAKSPAKQAKKAVKPAPKKAVKKAPVKPSAKVAKKPSKPVAKKPTAPAKPVKKPAAAKTKPAAKPAKSPAHKAAAPKAAAPKAAAPKAAAPKAHKPVASKAVAAPVKSSSAKQPILQEVAKPKTNGFHSPAFIQKQRQRLLDLRDDLVDSMSGMTRDTIRNAPEGSEASGSGQHQGDAGSDAYDRDFALSVLAKEQDALYEIEQALRRIQAGTYGICEISSNKIPQARLEAIPFARLTVECQAQWEKEYGKRRFRPSNEVGFSGGNQVDDEDSETVSLDEEED